MTKIRTFALKRLADLKIDTDGSFVFVAVKGLGGFGLDKADTAEFAKRISEVLQEIERLNEAIASLDRGEGVEMELIDPSHTPRASQKKRECLTDTSEPCLKKSAMKNE